MWCERHRDRSARSAERTGAGGHLVKWVCAVALAAATPGPWETQMARAADVPDRSVDTGFLFVNGHYVAPPYRVSVDEDGVRINGFCVREAPRPPKVRPIPKEDPGDFKWTPDLLARGIGKSGFLPHATLRFRYWEREHGFDEACKRFETYLANQPLVKRTKRGGTGDWGLLYWLKGGEMRGISFSRRRATPPKPPEPPESALVREGSGFHKILAGGGALFFGRGCIAMTKSAVEERLPKIHEIITSAKSVDRKAAQLVARGLLPKRTAANVLATGFRESLALKRRIGDLKRASPPD